MTSSFQVTPTLEIEHPPQALKESPATVPQASSP